MVFRSAAVTVDELERVAGWRLKPEALCRGERCVPLRAGDKSAVALIDVACRPGEPLVHDERHALWALGAAAGGHVLASASARISNCRTSMSGRSDSLHLAGQVLLGAWASCMRPR